MTTPARTTEQEGDRVTTAAWRQLAEHVNDLSRHGPEYMRRYTEACLAGGKGTVRCRQLPVELERLVRECVEDELMWNRRKRAHVT